MEKLKSNTGKVHIKQGDNGTLCHHYLRRWYYLGETDEPVTGKSCLKISNQNKPNREDNLILAESFMDRPEESNMVKVCFGSKINVVTTFFKTKAEKAAYIIGIKDALTKIRGQLITINGERM